MIVLGGRTAEMEVKSRWHELVPAPRPWIGNQGLGNLTAAANERVPPTVRGWGIQWLTDAKRQRIPYQLMPEGAPWFSRCPNDGGGMGAKATTKLQGSKEELVAKAAATLYIGRKYTRGPEPCDTVVDFYKRGPLDEAEASRDWCPDWFREVPIYQPISQERLRELHMDQVKFQAWPRELDENEVL
ncbi:MAG: hypothetical protein GY772_02790, partial [bacterium]|nr:hypothetical protein [bacterium]